MTAPDISQATIERMTIREAQELAERLSADGVDLNALDPDDLRRLLEKANASAAPEYSEQVDQWRERLRAQQEAKEQIEAERAVPLEWWSIDELLSSPSPEYLIERFLYRNSLSRLFGAPGGGKTFVAIDMAMCVALGREWAGHRVARGPVVFVMAEGQAVNRDRIAGWLAHRGVGADELAGRFIAVPHAVLLTPPAMRDFLARVAELRPALVILDTKNAMMVGDENSATDFATLRRALDSIRHVSDACVMLIDHTGHNENGRARGSSAGTGAMDTEIRAEKDAASVSVVVTRDKAAEHGTTATFELTEAAPSAVLVPTHSVGRARDSDESAAWRIYPIPADLVDATGPGAAVVPDLARFMAYYHEGDRDLIGQTRAEALRAIGLKVDAATGRRAWSWLRDGEWIKPTSGKPENETGRHIWNTERGPQ